MVERRPRAAGVMAAVAVLAAGAALGGYLTRAFDDQRISDRLEAAEENIRAQAAARTFDTCQAALQSRITYSQFFQADATRNYAIANTLDAAVRDAGDVAVAFSRVAALIRAGAMESERISLDRGNAPTCARSYPELRRQAVAAFGTTVRYVP